VDVKVGTRYEVIDLIPNGRHIAVSNENKEKFIEAITHWKLVEQTKQQV
jgi:E3 ubiquitin-protein ligase NEDD4